MKPSTRTESPTQAFDWSYIWSIVKEHKAELTLAHLAAMVISISTAFLPLLFPLLVDEVLLEQPGRMVAWIDGWFPDTWHGPKLYIGVVLVVTLAIRMLALGLGVVQSRLFTRVSKDITFRVRKALLHRLKRVSMSELETLGSGRVSSHLVVDLGTVETFIGSTLSRIVLAVFTVSTVAAILLWIHWPLAIFILVLNPLIFFVSGVFSTWMKHLKKSENAAFESFQEALTETFEAVQQIRANNREGHYFDRLIGKARKVKAHSVAYGWKSQAARGVSTLVYLFGFDLFRASAMLMVVFSDLTVGEVFAIFAYLWYMMTPVQELIGLQYFYFSASAALGRIQRVAHLKLEPQFSHEQDPFKSSSSVGIRVEDLHFAYGRGPEVLKGVNLSISAGEKVAFVGASGGGKSTLIQALLGLYPPSKGSIFYGDVAIEQIGLDVVRSHVGVVLQRPAMLNGSVRENLLLGEERSDEEIWDALDLAQLRTVVEDLDQGLDSVIGIRGTRLSGGQRQRLAIARMVLADPKIIILDESTSQVDLQTEEAIYRGLMKRFHKQTILIVAHRLSSLRHADRVFVFEAGRISGHGAHETLITDNELYSKLYGSQ